MKKKLKQKVLKRNGKSSATYLLAFQKYFIPADASFVKKNSFSSQK